MTSVKIFVDSPPSSSSSSPQTRSIKSLRKRSLPAPPSTPNPSRTSLIVQTPLRRTKTLFHSASTLGLSTLYNMGFLGTPRTGPASVRSLSPLPPQISRTLSGQPKVIPNIRNLKKQTSVSSLAPFASYPVITRPVTPCRDENRTSPAVQMVEPRKAFKAKQHFVEHGSMKMQPHQEEAPYMQSYDRTLLDSDRASEILLKRIAKNGSSSFHDYAQKPPMNVLDLGCGSGSWVLDAASEWKQFGTQVTGFDMVDVRSSIWEDTTARPPNAIFVMGNFVKYALPFPDNSFDLVRMANLSLCVPFGRWEFVFREVRRILTQSGRLEFIDDDIFFPYDSPPKTNKVFKSALVRPNTRRRKSRSLSSFTEEDENYDDFGADFAGYQVIQKKRVRDSLESIICSSEDGSAVEDDIELFDSPIDPAEEWKSRADSCRGLETVFKQMLLADFDIRTHPHEFVLGLLRKVFGKPHANLIKNTHVSLAPVEKAYPFSIQSFPGPPNSSVIQNESTSTLDTDNASVLSSDSGYASLKAKKKSDKKRSSLSHDSTPPGFVPGGTEVISSKAAERLGIIQLADPVNNIKAIKRQSTLNSTVSLSSSFDAASVFSSTSSSSGQIPGARRFLSGAATKQSTGLVCFPEGIFIGFKPEQLELHACKNMHILLGCKPAIREFLDKFRDETGEEVVCKEEFESVFWEYECFRRRRFNWPGSSPGLKFEAESSGSFKHKPASSSGSAPVPTTGRGGGMGYKPMGYKKDELTHVRTIRVFEAVKVSL